MTNRRDHLEERWEDAFNRAESGHLVPFEELAAGCSDEKERDVLRLKYGFLMRIARTALTSQGREVRTQRSSREFVVKIISVSLAIALLGTVASVCYLALSKTGVPDFLVAIASALIGYLVGIITGVLGIPEKSKSEPHDQSGA